MRRHLWAIGCRVVPGDGGITARVVAMLPDAVRSVTDFWGPRWPQRALVITTASTEQFGALAASEGQMSRRRRGHRIHDPGCAQSQRYRPAHRDDPAARDLSDPLLAVVLRHELVFMWRCGWPPVPTHRSGWPRESPSTSGARAPMRDSVMSRPTWPPRRAGTAPAWPTDEAFAGWIRPVPHWPTRRRGRLPLSSRSATEDALRRFVPRGGRGVDDAAAKTAVRDAIGIPEPGCSASGRPGCEAERG